MKLLQFPHPKLLTPCEDILTFNLDVSDILDYMWYVMEQQNGIGLSANQIGFSLSMFVMDGPEGRLDLVNPYISLKSKGFANLKEGCLSAPGEFIVVPDRAEWVQVKFQDKRGIDKSVVLKGIHAVCAQHEIEHLEGKSFMEHKSLSRNVRNSLAGKWGIK